MRELAHEASMEGASPDMEFFTVPPTQTTIEESEVIEYSPLASITRGGMIEFFISGSGDAYLDLNQTYLKINVRVTQANGNNLDADTQISTSNLLLHSLFSQVDVLLNEKLVSASDNCYAYRAYLETLLGYGRDAKKSFLQLSGYAKDDGGTMTRINPHDVDGEDNAGGGIKKRAGWISGSRELEMIGRLHTDITAQPLLLINGVDVRVKLSRSRDSFSLISSVNNAAFITTITSAVLLVRKVTPSPGALLAHSRALLSQNIKIPLRRTEIKVHTIPTGNHSMSWDNAFLGQQPLRIVLGLVASTNYNGSYDTNPFNFAHQNVNELSVSMGGKIYPSPHFTPNFPGGRYAREYLSLFQATGKNRSDEGLDIELSEYAGGYALYAFDLTPDWNASESHMNLLKEGAVRIKISFSEATPAPINLVVYSEFQSVIEIDKSRNVVTEF